MLSGTILTFDKSLCVIIDDQISNEKLDIASLNVSNEAKMFLDEFLEEKFYYFKDKVTKTITLGLKKTLHRN